MSAQTGNGLSFKDLFGPNTKYPYFERAVQDPERFGFVHKSRKFEMVNAGWLADASLLVYIDKPDIVSGHLDKVEMKARCFGFGGKSTQCFVAHNNDFAIVSFRGIEIKEPIDVYRSVDIFPMGSEPGGKVHGGFQKALNEIWKELQRHLRSIADGPRGKRTVWFTGHSLGAAVATLAAGRYKAQGEGDVRGLYTFGSPRVGDSDFEHGYRVNAYRFVNNNDIVTRVPPSGMGFRHVGDMKYITADGEIEDDMGFWRKIFGDFESRFEHLLKVGENWWKGLIDAVLIDDLADHLPSHYAEKIWKNI